MRFGAVRFGAVRFVPLFNRPSSARLPELFLVVLTDGWVFPPRRSALRVCFLIFVALYFVTLYFISI